MIRKLPLVSVVILAAIGCGAGSGASDSPREKTSAMTQTDETPVPKTVTPAGVVATDAGGTEAVTGMHRATPAVDTSDLRDAPSWELVDLDGTPLRSTELLGKVVLVDFWATWCGPCKRSIPHLIDLQERYGDKGLKIVGVSVDQQGPRVVKPFVDQAKINYQVVMGTGKVVQDFGGVRGIPTAFIISQDGKIYRKIVGLVPKEKYETDIKALLGLS